MTTLPSIETAVAFRDVWKRYGVGPGREVFEGLSVDVPATGVTFVVGRSGAGKSVLSRLAVGLERPDRGEVLLFDEPLSRLGERQILRLRRNAPYLVQGPALLDWLTVAQNVALAARSAKQEPAEVLRALRRVGLEEVADRLPSQLGPGVRKRVAIARALVLEPRFLLLDEPTTGLDKASARQVSDVLSSLGEEGLGAMVVSHDYPLLERLADRVIMVADGTASVFETAESFLGSDEPEVRALISPVEPEIRRATLRR